MKKFLLLLLLLVVPFMLVGCGDKDDDDDSPKKSKNFKVIECTSEMESSGFKIGIYANVEFNEKKQEVGNAYAKYTYDYSEMSDAFKEAYEKTDVCEPFKSNSTFTNCKSEFKDSKAIITVDLDTSEMKAKDGDKEETAEDFAEELEKSLGGECTIK
jgi:uncharacterized lipoprotein NlpE involved in copper resistance